MSDVEGVTPEETTAAESVENTPAPEESQVTETEGNEAEIENAENEDESPQEALDDEQLEKLLNDPKAKEILDKRIQEEVDKKTARQKAANRQLQRKVEQLQALRDKPPLEKPEQDSFETQEEYEAALDKYNEEVVDRKAEEKLLEKEAQTAASERIEEAREVFETHEAEVKAADPQYDENMAVVQEYIKMIPDGDQGFQEFSRYIALESGNGPALMNHLGANPDKIEALMGKPPALIKRKLAQYERELSAPKDTPAPKPKPKPAPPSKAGGAAKPRNLHNGDVLENLGLK